MSIWSFLHERGFGKMKLSIYLFGSALGVVFFTLLGMPPHWAAATVMGIGVAKQLVWDMLIHGYPFDWFDILFMFMGVSFGFLVTSGYFKIKGE